jgi:hypothetical protein
MGNFFKKGSLLASVGMLMTVLSAPIVKAVDFTLDDADKMFASRELDTQGLANALKSADMYHQLFEEAKSAQADLLDQTALLVKESEAMYFYADNHPDNEVKKAGHLRGWEIAQLSSKILTGNQGPTSPLKPEYKRTLGESYYWKGANMGKWGLANGVLNSLRRWPELRETMEHIQQLDEVDVEYYGPNRILCRSYFKLPFPLGDRSKAFQLIKEAYEQTLDANGEISIHSTNVLYYAEILIARDETEQAKEMLTKLISKGESEETLRAYNDERMPETKADIMEAKRILARL